MRLNSRNRAGSGLMSDAMRAHAGSALPEGPKSQPVDGFKSEHSYRGCPDGDYPAESGSRLRRLFVHSGFGDAGADPIRVTLVLGNRAQHCAPIS